ncbi:magnesium transporter [Cladochytrium replicatum]|nr:magnesium transporter [Cladochytrium replicatum]
MLPQIAYAVGVILLLHSGYSAYDHIAYLKVVGKQERSLPIEILAECIISTVVCVIAIAFVSGSLRPVSLEHELKNRSLDVIDNHPSFRTLQHRGRVLLGHKS